MATKNFKVKLGLETANLFVSGTSNLGPVSNITITGGTTGQFLQTDGSGVLTWATSSGSGATGATGLGATGATGPAGATGPTGSNISNGTSNVNIPSVDGNVNISVDGTANVLVITTTGANVTGNLTATLFIGNGNSLSSIQGANIVGTVANANFALTSNTANSVNIANVTGLVLNPSTIYVGLNGNDTTGNGTVINPYRTISKAVDVAGSGSVIIVFPGGYYEDVTINDKSTITISSDTPGGRQPFTPAIYGNLTISGNSTSVCVKGIGVEKTVSHTSSGTVYLSEFQIGSGNVVGALSKTGNGSLSVQNSSAGLVSGANITPVTISGAGNVFFSNVVLGLLSVSNASAAVSMLNDSTSLQANISAGSLNIFDSVLYTLANSGSNAIVGTGGTVNVRNSIAINPDQTPARLDVGATTVLAYDDFYFDRSNSNVGINPNITIDFQSLRLSNTLTASLLTGTLTTAAQPNITSVGNLSSLTVTGTSNLNSVSNVTITGGSNGQFLQTNGSGVLTWATPAGGAGGANIANGTSNVNIPTVDGNVNTSVGGTANVLVITGTGVNAAGYLTATGNITGANLTSTRIITRTANNGATTSGTITPNADTSDQFNIIGLTDTTTIAIPSGTFTDGQKLTLRIKDDGTSRTLSFTTSGANSYRVIGTILPTSTTANKVSYIGCVYNSQDSFWDVVAVTTQA